MQFKDLPEFIQEKAIFAIIATHFEKGISVKAAEEIRDALVTIYSEDKNADAYAHLDSAVKEATCSILCKNYSPCGTHIGNVHIVVEDDAHKENEIGEFKNFPLYAPKGIKGMIASKHKSNCEPEHKEINKLSSPERLLLVNAIANAIISTVKEIKKPVGSHDFEQAMKSVREMCTPGI